MLEYPDVSKKKCFVFMKFKAKGVHHELLESGCMSQFTWVGCKFPALNGNPQSVVQISVAFLLLITVLQQFWCPKAHVV